MKRRQLILHADDLGIARDVNKASFEALENGWITSASVMVPAPHFSTVASFVRKNNNFFDLGIHLTFTSEWKRQRIAPCSNINQVKSLVDKDGYFHSSVENFVKNAKPEEILLEAQTQIQVALDSGIVPTHLDCHMFALYGHAKLRAIMSSIAVLNGLPFIFPDKRVFWIKANTSAQDWPKTYIEMILNLPPGLSQLIVHLGHDTESLSQLMGRNRAFGSAWRQRDLEFFGSYFFLGFLKKQSIQLTNWKSLRQETLL